MAENLTVAQPDFDLIRTETGRATETAFRAFWLILNDELSRRRRLVRDAKEKIEGKILTSTVTTNQNNFDTQGALIVLFTGASAFNVTGLANGTEGRVVILMVIGAGTMTVVHASTSSAALNRFRTFSLANVGVGTDKMFVAQYANSLWRELKLA